tara:strand:+ start:63 stop:635 length:573 start_codon:yes stop_codon:yes gene_type:complete
MSLQTYLEVTNAALLRLGANRISAFNEKTTESVVTNEIILPLQRALLSSHPWGFATTQSELSESSSPPIADFDKAFDLPSDFLRVISAGTGNRGAGLDYRIHHKKLHTNADNVKLTYIFEPNPDDWPHYFRQLISAQMAAEICIAITESTSRSELMFDLADKEFQRAKLIDAQQESPAAIDGFSLIQVRD